MLLYNPERPVLRMPPRQSVYGWQMVMTGWVVIGSLILALAAPYLNEEYFSEVVNDTITNITNNWGHL